MRKLLIGLAIGAAAFGVAPSFAHHSFAVFFDANKLLTITGKVTEFNFVNPHGLIALDVTGPDGKVSEWRVETNAPVVLMRRGWARDSIHVGDVITINGWASRDGKPYLRLRDAKRADGTEIGQPFDTSG